MFNYDTRYFTLRFNSRTYHMKMRCINTDFLQPVLVTRAEMVLPDKNRFLKNFVCFAKE